MTMSGVVPIAYVIACLWVPGELFLGLGQSHLFSNSLRHCRERRFAVVRQSVYIEMLMFQRTVGIWRSRHQFLWKQLFFGRRDYC